MKRKYFAAKKKLLYALILAWVLVSLVVNGVMLVKAEQSQIIPNITEQLPSGWKRLSPKITMHILSESNGIAQVEFIASTAPATLSDNVTLIDNKWYLQIDPSGQRWYENGNNIFKARVTKNKTVVLDSLGRLTEFASVLSLDTATFGSGFPEIVNDPIIGTVNTSLAWRYAEYKNGAVLTRYLRSVNGHVSELWILSADPETSLVFRPNLKQETKFGGKTTPMIAFDSDYKILDMSVNEAKGFYVLSPVSLASAKYPLYVDPTFNFGVQNDARLEVSDSVYATAHNAVTGVVVDGDFPASIGQTFFAGFVYQVNRSYVIFDTSALPTNTVITTAYIDLYGVSNNAVSSNFNIYICSGQPTYPHNPPTGSDYAFANYQNDAGSGFPVTAYSWVAGQYNELTLSNTGWITKGGLTKLALRSSRDISSTPPTGDEYVAFWQVEHGGATAPFIRVVGTIPIGVPVITTTPASGVTTTSATLNGYVVGPSGASISTQFQYGPTAGYGLTTPWISGYIAGNNFSAVVAGLNPGTVYHYRAAGTDTAGTGVGTDLTFTTAPLAPTYFSATGGNAHVDLAWTKGVGADKTVILRKTGSYPASQTDGTIVYSNTGTSFNDNPLTNGVAYFYKAWSLAIDGITYSVTTAQSTATPNNLSAPSIDTVSSSGVTATDATLQGNLTSMGGYASVDTSFDYGTTLAYGSNTGPVAKTATGIFTATIVGTLIPATPYHFRAVGTNLGGTTNGADMTFTTSSPSGPTMTTNAATGVQVSAAQLNGAVTSDGGAPPVTVWFEYGLTAQYESGATPTAAGLATGGTFYYGVGSLVSATTYHYRAVGQNSLGITYGNDQTFITLTPTAPTANSNAATTVGAAQATLQGTLLTDGGALCDLSFEWGTTGAYGSTAVALPSQGTAGTAYNALISGLVTGTTYHFRAVATNAGGTGTGSDLTFTTVFSPPGNLTAMAISPTTITLSWESLGDQSYIVYKSTGYPVDRYDGTLVYFGPNASANLSGLTGGITYYFSGWSWKTGDIWTTTNTNAIATTFAATSSNVIPLPTVPTGQNPTTPASWFDVPTNAVVRQLPLYDIWIGWATAFQVPEGTFLALCSLFWSVIAGALAFVAWRQAIPAVGASLVIIILAAVFQACPPIFATFIAAIEIGGGYGLMSLGGNIAGKGV